MRPAPGIQIESQPEAVLLAITLWGEARNQGPLGMLAVAHVIMNRAADVSVRSVILKPLQFSCLNHNDPNRGKLLDAYKLEPEAWGQASAVSELVLSGRTKDPTDGAVNYLTKNLYNSSGAPEWAKNMKVTAEIGAHVFGKA